MMTLALMYGPRLEAVVFEPLMESGAVKRSGLGRTNSRPHRVARAKGSSSRHMRYYGHQHDIRTAIPRKQHACSKGPFRRVIYRIRYRIARLVNRCMQFQRSATRDEKRATNHRAMWLIAATFLW
jgi:hypothetical protein